MPHSFERNYLPIVGEKKATHDLADYFDEVMEMSDLEVFFESKIYKDNKESFVDSSRVLEWNNLLEGTPKDPTRLKIVHWNIERGHSTDEIFEFIQERDELREADIFLLSECDIGMGRSDNRNVPLDLARKLEMNYVFCNSFLSFDKGDEGEQEHRIPNALGLHGGAVFSRLPIKSAAVVSLPRGIDYMGNMGEKRLGSRRALAVEIEHAGVIYELAVIHLELKSSPEQRGEQLECLLKFFNEKKEQLIAQKNYQPRVQMLGGDFNTTGMDLRGVWPVMKHLVREILPIGIEGTKHAFLNPLTTLEHFLGDAIDRQGFNVDGLNVPQSGTHHYDFTSPVAKEKTLKYVPLWIYNYVEKRAAGKDGRVPCHLDWFVGRILNEAKVKWANPATFDVPKVNGKLISDHNPIVVDYLI